MTVKSLTSPLQDLLKTFGLSRNPFTDRTAEKTSIDPLSLYIHSDLRCFKPNETTYVFFGRRGSGKTTIRLQMEEAYRQYNQQAVETNKSRGHFMVDLARPGHMTACLAHFQETIGATIENWDATFSDAWRTADLVDCILSYAATVLIKKVTSPDKEGKDMMERLKQNPKVGTWQHHGRMQHGRMQHGHMMGACMAVIGAGRMVHGRMDALASMA